MFSELLQLIIKIWRPIVVLAGMIVIIVLVVMWLSMIVGFVFALPFTNYLLPDRPFMSFLGAAAILLMVGIPVFYIATRILRLLFKTKLNHTISSGLGVAWIVSIITFFTVAVTTAKQFNQGARSLTTYDIPTTEVETLEIKVMDEHLPDAMTTFNNLEITEDYIVNSRIYLDVVQADDEKFKIEQLNRARGKNAEEANHLVDQIDYQVHLEDDLVKFPQHFLINKGEKWRGQNVKIIIHVPKGKAVKVDRSIYRIINHFEKEDDFRYTSFEDNQIWEMRNDGFIHTNAPVDSEGKNGVYGFKDFNKLQIDGLMKVQIKHGDFYRVRLDGRHHYLKDVNLKKKDETLIVSSDLTRTGSPIRLYVTMPSLEKLDSKNTDDISIYDFQQDKMHIQHEGKYDIKLNADIDELEVVQKGKHELDLRGKGKRLKIKLEEGASLDAERYSVLVGDISMENGKAKLSVSDSLYQKLIGEENSIKIDGEPIIMKR